MYKDAEYTLTDDMVEQAERILSRCRGLPLVIATIGGLLANRPKTSREWMKLCEHLGLELESDRDIKRLIISSYDGLPYHLKSCLLYLSLFPENHEIRFTRLLRRWMAEGYIAELRDMTVEDDMTVEEVGLSHYNELINRSMILPPKKKVNASMAIERCQVHGMVRQIILSKLIEENQVFIIRGHCNDVPQSKIRHLVVTRWKRSEEKISSINLSLIRSLTVFGQCPVSLISPKLRLLRVLDLEDTVDLENDDLKHIGELLHLRYLGLRGTKISRLPSLQNLRCLETLDVQDTKVTQLPDGISKLEKLRYLIAGVNFAEDLVEKMEGKNAENNATKCNGNFLGTLADLVCRCCRDHKECCESPSSCCAGQFSVRAPEGIEKLRNLQMLGVVHIGQGSRVAKKLGRLTSLRRLGVDLCATEEEGMELCMSIGRLVRLERLEVRSESLEFLTDMDKSPPKHLLSLRLCGHLGEFPGWISSLNDLAKVKLLRTQLKQEDIVLIGNLRNLASLGLWGKSYTGESLRFLRHTFKKLKLLDIEGLEKIKTVQIEDGAMPELEKLRVKKCPTLSDSKDGLSGVLFLRNLNELVLTSCGDKSQLEMILQRQVSIYAKRPKLLLGLSHYPSDPAQGQQL